MEAAILPDSLPKVKGCTAALEIFLRMLSRFQHMVRRSLTENHLVRFHNFFRGVGFTSKLWKCAPKLYNYPL